MSPRSWENGEWWPAENEKPRVWTQVHFWKPRSPSSSWACQAVWSRKGLGWHIKQQKDHHCKRSPPLGGMKPFYNCCKRRRLGGWVYLPVSFRRESLSRRAGPLPRGHVPLSVSQAKTCVLFPCQLTLLFLSLWICFQSPINMRPICQNPCLCPHSSSNSRNLREISSASQPDALWVLRPCCLLFIVDCVL